MDTRLKNSGSRYGLPVIALHWLMLVLIAAVYASMELRGFAPRGSALRAGMKSLHFALGLSVLALVAVRLCVRWMAGAEPPIAPPLSRWPALGARLMHVALYALMIAAPLLGWLTLSAAGKPVDLFGFALPLLTGVDAALAHSLKELHESLATAGYALIGLHAAAALLHHYVMRDNTLVRMLPGCGTR